MKKSNYLVLQKNTKTDINNQKPICEILLQKDIDHINGLVCPASLAY